MNMEIEVDLDDLSKRTADDRGRVTIGKEYAGKTVTVAVVDVEEEDDV